MRLRILELESNDTTEQKLASHGLSLDDAFDVFEDTPRFFPQKRRAKEMRQGRIRYRPARIKMIGFNRAGDLCRIIIEYPDNELVSEVVTGYWATSDDWDKYEKAGGHRT